MKGLKENSVKQMYKRPLILAVDDEEPIRKLLRVNLSLEGYGVVTASDGKRALELLEEHNPDLMLLDITMPGLDGLQVLELIRERSTVPVIILTARGDINYLKSSLLNGADDFITKPFSLKVLSARIGAKLRRVRQRKKPLTMQDMDLVARSLTEIRATSTAVSGSNAHRGFLQQLHKMASGQSLTEREIEILTRVANGANNRQVALELEINEQTVRNHMTSVLRKLQAKNRAQAATLAAHLGLISPPVNEFR
jgi:DNA-binding NarL/FixJ family response regulator